MTLSEPQIVQVIAFCSMLLRFMHIENKPDGARIGLVEDMMELTAAILQHIGEPPFVLAMEGHYKCPY